MENIKMHEFKHPNYYKELRAAGNELAKRNAVKEDLASSGSSPARNKSDQAISDSQATAEDSVRPGPGLKLQATSSKPKGTSCSFDKTQAGPGARRKPQAPSSRVQAPSHKRQAS